MTAKTERPDQSAAWQGLAHDSSTNRLILTYRARRLR